MIAAKLNDGFEVEVNEEFLNDSELMEKLLNKNGALATFFLRDCMLTAENKARLYDHLRNEKGVVPLDALDAALGELANSFTAGKNSASSPA